MASEKQDEKPGEDERLPKWIRILKDRLEKEKDI